MVESEPISAEWAFAIFRAVHYEPAGRPIARITKQLGNLDAVIWRELGLRVRAPGGVWGGIGRKREYN